MRIISLPTLRVRILQNEQSGDARLHQGAPAAGAPGGHLHGQRARGARRRKRARVLKAVPLRQAGRACASQPHQLLVCRTCLAEGAARCSSMASCGQVVRPACCAQCGQGPPAATRQAAPAALRRTAAGAHQPREAARARPAAAGPRRAPAGRSPRRRRRCRRPPRPPRPAQLPPPAGPRPPAAPRQVTELWLHAQGCKGLLASSSTSGRKCCTGIPCHHSLPALPCSKAAGKR